MIIEGTALIITDTPKKIYMFPSKQGDHFKRKGSSSNHQFSGAKFSFGTTILGEPRKKAFLVSVKYGLFNKDPYFMVYL